MKKKAPSKFDKKLDEVKSESLWDTMMDREKAKPVPEAPPVARKKTPKKKVGGKKKVTSVNIKPPTVPQQYQGMIERGDIKGLVNQEGAGTPRGMYYLDMLNNLKKWENEHSVPAIVVWDKSGPYPMDEKIQQYGVYNIVAADSTEVSKAINAFESALEDHGFIVYD